MARVTETRSGRAFWQRFETYPAEEERAGVAAGKSERREHFGDSRLQIGIPRDRLARCLLAPFEWF